MGSSSIVTAKYVAILYIGQCMLSEEYLMWILHDVSEAGLIQVTDRHYTKSYFIIFIICIILNTRFIHKQL
jgi:hypothetical protein